jgi:hypothetical protein
MTKRGRARRPIDISSSPELRLTTDACCAVTQALIGAGRDAPSGENRIAFGCCKSFVRSPVILLYQKKKNATPSTAYARSRNTPSSQFDSASLITDEATPTASAMLTTSIAVNAKSIGW